MNAERKLNRLNFNNANQMMIYGVNEKGCQLTNCLFISYTLDLMKIRRTFSVKRGMIWQHRGIYEYVVFFEILTPYSLWQGAPVC